MIERVRLKIREINTEMEKRIDIDRKTNKERGKEIDKEIGNQTGQNINKERD